MKEHIGFIGQGWIGKHYADDFESRGYSVVRYALEEPYVQNKVKLLECEIVLIAVPTPTTPEGFSDAAVRSALSTLKPGTIAVIKSTLVPGTTTKLQADFKELFVFHSPEFLREATAAHDAANPDRTIIGVPTFDSSNRNAAKKVMSVLPKAPYESIMPALEAELVKYAGNCFLYTKVLFMNTMYDMVSALGGDYELVREAMIHDERIGDSHTSPVHKSGHDTENAADKRGAGGHCFIKDFEAFRQLYEEHIGTDAAAAMLDAMISYNNKLLRTSDKDTDILEAVYGSSVERKQVAA